MEVNNLSVSSSPSHSRAPLVVAAIVSTLGGFLFGYDNIVISGAIGYLSQLFHLDAAGVGWAAGCALGFATGVLIGQSPLAMRALDPLFQVLRTVPPLAWLPISLAAFRHADPSAIFVIFITSIWPIIINTAVGIRNIPQDYRNVAAVLRLNPLTGTSATN